MSGEDTCDFGHVFEINGDHAEIESDEIDADNMQEAIKNGEVKDLDDVKEAMGQDNYFLKGIMGEPIKDLKVKANSQGTPHTSILVAADKFDTELEWDTALSEERIYISPQSEFHNDYLQKKQQAEQQVKQGMQSIEQMKKQKHLLEHDIRKLRSRVENLKSGNEEVLKGDFVQLVDGAGAGGGGGGGDQQALKFLRDNNIYPTIVSDFYEMESVDDLEDGPLSELPENEKAILKKKYTMYEKWKDLFGSEVQRKLQDLKGELKRVEQALESAEQSIEEPVRDMVMINQKSQDQLKNEIGKSFSYQRHSTEVKNFEFIASQGVEVGENGLVDTDDDPSHYKIFYIHAVHVNIAGAADPRTPQEGPTVARIFWHPAIVCEHVYERIFEEKKNWLGDKYKQVMQEYTGEMESEEGEELKEAREEKGMPIRTLRKKIGEKVGEDRPPLELSATIRRIEDGFDKPEVLKEEFEENGEEYLDAINEILGKNFGENNSENDYKPVRGLNSSLRKFLGTTDRYYIEKPGSYVDNMHNWFKFNYYYDMKKSLGLYTMK